MRFWFAIGLLPALLASGSWGQQNHTYPPMQDVMVKLPECALTCLLKTPTPCNLMDMGCLCNDQTYFTASSDCVQRSCTLVDALSTLNTTATACSFPKRSRQTQFVVSSIVLGALTIFFVFLRLFVKRFLTATSTLSLDDKLLLCALPLRIACTVLGIVGLSANGLGVDIWNVDPHMIPNFAQYLFVEQIMYLAEMAFIKIILTIFYLQIFPGTFVRRVLYATLVANILFGVVLCTVAVFQCTPVDYFWTQFDVDVDPATNKGHCVDIIAFAWATSAITIALGVLMTAIPLSQIPQLQLHWKKKLEVGIMFFVGSFVTVVSILRLHALVTSSDLTNPTYDKWNVIYWSTIEVNVGLICICLPTLRLVVVRLFPRLRGTQYGTGDSSVTQKTGQNTRSTRDDNKEIALADLESRSVHPWKRISELSSPDKRPVHLADSRVQDWVSK